MRKVPTLDRRQFIGSSGVALLAAATPRLTPAATNTPTGATTSPTINVGASEHAAWLEPALHYMHDWLQFQMRMSEQPGCSVAVAHSGRVVYEAAFGSANLKARRALTPRHRFRIASHSKTFTATALMKLREKGAVRLDDPLGRYLKDLHPQLLTRTVEQLISNSSGIFRDGLENSYWIGKREFPDTAELRRDFQLPPVIDGGSRLKYSNHGFALAGMVIEAITGESYVSWVGREVVQAAGLKETTPEITPQSREALAQGHSDKIALGRRIVYPGDQSTRALAPATGFVSTAADLCRFFGQLSPHAQTSLLSADSRRAMAHGRWKDPFSSSERWYGLGTISGKQKEWEWFGHSGGFLGYVTRSAVVPAQGLSVSVLTNAADGESGEWLDGVLNILQRFQADPRPPKAGADWSGRWWYDWGATDLVPLGDKVIMASPESIDPFEKAPELSLTGPDEATISEAGGFKSYGEKVKLQRDADRRVTSVMIAGSKYIREAQFVQELRSRYPE